MRWVTSIPAVDISNNFANHVQLTYAFVAVTNERWLRWAIARHFREQGYKVTIRSIKVGNASIDGEVTGGHWRMAIEI